MYVLHVPLVGFFHKRNHIDRWSPPPAVVLADGYDIQQSSSWVQCPSSALVCSIYNKLINQHENTTTHTYEVSYNQRVSQQWYLDRRRLGYNGFNRNYYATTACCSTTGNTALHAAICILYEYVYIPSTWAASMTKTTGQKQYIDDGISPTTTAAGWWLFTKACLGFNGHP